MKFDLNRLYADWKDHPTEDNFADLFKGVRSLSSFCANSILSPEEYGNVRDDAAVDAAYLVCTEIAKPDFELREASFHTWCLHVMRREVFRWAEKARKHGIVHFPGSGTVPMKFIDASIHLPDGDEKLDIAVKEPLDHIDHHKVLDSDLSKFLTRREMEVWNELKKGRTQQEAADFLGIRQQTVAETLRRIEKKLGDGIK